MHLSFLSLCTVTAPCGAQSCGCTLIVRRRKRGDAIRVEQSIQRSDKSSKERVEECGRARTLQVQRSSSARRPKGASRVPFECAAARPRTVEA